MALSTLLCPYLIGFNVSIHAGTCCLDIPSLGRPSVFNMHLKRKGGDVVRMRMCNTHIMVPDIERILGGFMFIGILLDGEVRVSGWEWAGVGVWERGSGGGEEGGILGVVCASRTGCLWGGTLSSS